MTTVPYAPLAGNRIAIFAPHWLGDAVMALPAVADIRRARPDATLVVVARPSIAPLYQLAPGIDAIEVFDDRGRLSGERLERLKTHAFDTAVLLPNSFRSALAAWRAGIPERCGYRSDWRGPLLTRAASRPVGVHQVASYQELVRALGCANGSLVPELRVPAEARHAAEVLLTSGGWDGRARLVAFAPGAANGRAKQWPPRSFAAAAAAMMADGAVPVFVGTSADVPVVGDVLQAIDGIQRGTVVNLAGRTDLPALAGVLVHCGALVTNDSGGMHLAAALGINVTAMFGPSREKETRPLGSREPAGPTHPVWCRPCMLRDCPIDHRCMRGISVDAVVVATRRGLSTNV